MRKFVLAMAVLGFTTSSMANEYSYPSGNSESLSYLMRKIDQIERKNLQLADRVRDLEDNLASYEKGNKQSSNQDQRQCTKPDIVEDHPIVSTPITAPGSITVGIPNLKPNFACSIKNSITGMIHFGKGKNRLDAEYTAKQSCKAGEYRFNCENRSLVCEEELPGSQFTCVVNNTSDGNVFKGNGTTKVEAEALALKACTSGNYKMSCVAADCSE